jgi:hypothetical protein
VFDTSDDTRFTESRAQGEALGSAPNGTPLGRDRELWFRFAGHLVSPKRIL